ncbi:Hypothetical predicted protein [Mytilus galloprovincialis]|uniref:Uncharacterized protein n=1 Tax=Mytilus galloprovincialis TaxID=29158 RepID=A0A8B6EG03_MYTGA|nr:Hypothetical predicted protein [Mytilus galloprovincialis]
MRVISGTKWGPNSHTLRNIYVTLRRSKIDYGCQIYNTASYSTKQILESLPPQALRTCTDVIEGASLSECPQPPWHLLKPNVSTQLHNIITKKGLPHLIKSEVIVGPRTTNNLERWHSKIKKIVQTPHPNIYKLIELLQCQEAVSRCPMLQYAAGGKRINRRRKYREIETRLGNLKQRHANREMTTVQFADSASYLLHL